MSKIFWRLMVACLFVMPFCFANQYTLINVSISETFHRNVTFARDFDLNELTTYSRIEGLINVSNPSPHTVYNILVTLVSTSGIQGNISRLGGRNGSEYNSSQPGLPYYLHIPELRANDSVLFNYTVNGTAVNEPLNLSSDYSSNPFSTKVLAGENFTIKQNVRNQDTSQSTMMGVNITMNAQSINWSNASQTVNTNFSLSYRNQSDDWTNITQYSAMHWAWMPNNGTVPFNVTINATFNISAPFEVPNTATYLALIEELRYSSASTSSNLTVYNVTAGAQINFSETKRIVKPSNNIQDTNATWEVTAAVGTPLNVSFQLHKVTLWVTTTVDPNIYGNDSITGIRLIRNETPASEVNLTSVWSNVNAPWIFNFSDGTTGSPPPIVWMKPEYTILNKNNQILVYNATSNGTDLYLKYIYVISGYWLEVEKNVTNYAPDNYSIHITVRNKGNQPTPKNLTVTVYDLIPSGFLNISSMTPAPNSEQAVQNNVAGESNFSGIAYSWDIPRKGPYNASLLAKGSGIGNETFEVFYNVTGVGAYNVQNLFIVGLDPRQVDGAFASPLITIIVGLQNHSKEILYLGIVIFLLVLNITNLVVSSRINKQVDKKMPANYHEYQKLKEEIEALKRHLH